MGGGGGGEVQKKNSYKEFDNEKKFLRLENSPLPPENFSTGPSLRASATQASTFGPSINRYILIFYHVLEELTFWPSNSQKVARAT